MSLGNKVKELREKCELTQKQLADKSGITQATISRIESGSVKELKSDALIRLSNALNVTIDFLVGKTNKLSSSEIIDNDKDANFIFRGFEKLSEGNKKQLKDYVDFLIQKEGK